MSREIDKLNALLRKELGDCPMGGKFQWKRSEDVKYLAKSKSMTTASGIYIQGGAEKWMTSSFAEQLGPVWMLCQWKPPSCGASEWPTIFGQTLAYPANGNFMPTDVVLAEGVSPTMATTLELIGAIKQQLQDDVADHFARITAEAEIREQESASRLQNRFSDEYDAEDRKPEGLVYSLPNRKETSNDVNSHSRN